MIEPPRLLETVAQQTAIIHITVPRAEIQQAMGPAIGELMATIAAQGVAPVGPIYSHHLKMDPGMFDFEVGVAVAVPVQPVGRVVPGMLPATRVARTVYHGGYEGLGSAWGEFGAWIATQGLIPAEDLWECYITGPESSPDSSTWRTEFNRPVVAGS
jgi:effector-binding domain-containing protein